MSSAFSNTAVYSPTKNTVQCSLPKVDLKFLDVVIDIRHINNSVPIKTQTVSFKKTTRMPNKIKQKQGLNISTKVLAPMSCRFCQKQMVMHSSSAATKLYFHESDAVKEAEKRLTASASIWCYHCHRVSINLRTQSHAAGSTPKDKYEGTFQGSTVADKKAKIVNDAISIAEAARSATVLACQSADAARTLMMMQYDDTPNTSKAMKEDIEGNITLEETFMVRPERSVSLAGSASRAMQQFRQQQQQ